MKQIIFGHLGHSNHANSAWAVRKGFGKTATGATPWTAGFAS